MRNLNNKTDRKYIDAQIEAAGTATEQEFIAYLEEILATWPKRHTVTPAWTANWTGRLAAARRRADRRRR